MQFMRRNKSDATGLQGRLIQAAADIALAPGVLLLLGSLLAGVVGYGVLNMTVSKNAK